MIEHQTKVYNWQFIYLGANVDAFDEASKLAIPTAVNYAATGVGTRSVYNTVDTMVKNIREN
jgi:hypothetical protein